MSSKPKPNIITPFDDKQRFKNLVQEVINDTTIFTHTPDSISLSGVLFTLTLSNKKFIFEDIKVDIESDYVDIYLQGVKKPADIYSVTDNGTDIVINFTDNITLRPEDIVNTDFSVKGKIVSR
jgi:ribosome biogenesis SPOUT family RNA methylase Rps3